MSSDQLPFNHENGHEPSAGYLLMRLHRAFRAALDETLRPHGFTLPQMAVMLALGTKSGLSTADLARLAFVTPQAMGEVLAGLEAKGLVIRRAHDSHGRILPAELTPAGFDARQLCHDMLLRAEAQMMTGLSADERLLLGALLERCLMGPHWPQSQPLKARPNHERPDAIAGR